MRTFTLHLLIAVIWLLLSPQPDVGTFFAGWALGLALVWLFEPVLPAERYCARVAGAVRFVLIFLREFLAANFEMLRVVLFRAREDLHPGLFTLDVRELKRWEILLLSHCISLTPGTTTVQIEEDFSTLVIHALDAPEPDRVRQQIDRTLRRAVLGLSRG